MSDSIQTDDQTVTSDLIETENKKIDVKKSVMSDSIQTDDQTVTSDLIETENKKIDVKKEADRTVNIANKVIEVLPKILNGDLKLSQCPEFCDLTLTYALYGKLVDKLKKHQHKQAHVLPIILRFLFPGLVQFLPEPITNLSTHVRCFIQKAKRTGKLCHLYEPILKLYTAKHNLEWADFTKCGITQDMLVIGPNLPSSGCQIELKNRHIQLLLNLRNKYRLCWVKVVPQWLRFFRILQEDDCVQLQDIKSNWVELGVQANSLHGEQLQEFLDSPYVLPKEFIKKNIEPVPNSSNPNPSAVKKSARISSRPKLKQLQKVVNLLQSNLKKKEEKLATYRKKLNQKQDRLEDLSTRLCKTRLAKNYWSMKYHKISSVNLFDEVTEFNADLTYIQKIRKAAQYIKRIVQLRCSENCSPFFESLLHQSFIEELLEKILVQGINFDKGSNILLEILQELAQLSQETSTQKLESQESKNTSLQEGPLINNQIMPHGNLLTTEIGEISDSHYSSVQKNIEQFLQTLSQQSEGNSAANLELQESKDIPVEDCFLINNQIVPYGNPFAAVTKEIIEVSDSDSSSVKDAIKRNQSCNDKESINWLYDKTCKKSCDLSNKTNQDFQPETSNVPNQLHQNSSGLNRKVSLQFCSSKNSTSGLCNNEEMQHNSYIINTSKRKYNLNKECSKNSGHMLHKDMNNYQPNKKLRLERRKPSVAMNSNINASCDSYSLPPVLQKETCFSPSFKAKKSMVEESAKMFECTNSSPLGIKPNQHSKDGKLKDDLWILGDKYVSLLQTPNLESHFGGRLDTNDIIRVNGTSFSPNQSPPLLICENPDYQPHLFNRYISQVKPSHSEINLDSVEIIID